MRKREWCIAGVLLTIFVAIALYFRVYLPYKDVFTSLGVKFSSVDAYWHMRIVDNLVHNFPHLIVFDPYQIFPGGDSLDRTHFFDWLLAGIIWIASFGSPSEHLIDTVGAYYPAVLGALIVVPVYFIGKALFNRWVGLVAAGLTAVLPGEFLGRSVLGFTDHHVAEALFSTVALLFIILAVKSAAERKICLRDVARRNWSTLDKPVLYAVLAGFSLAIYMLVWNGSPLFIFIVALYMAVQFVIDHFRSKPTDYLVIVSVIFFLLAAVIAIPVADDFMYAAVLPIAVILPPVLALISRLISARHLKPVYFPLSVIGLGLFSLLVFRLLNPYLFGIMLGQFNLFSPTGASAQTTLEMQGLLFPNGQFSWVIAWGNYNITFFTSIIVLLVLVYFLVKGDNRQSNLLLIWSLVMFAATLGQRRFGYYLAVNIALLSGYGFWQVIWFAGSRIKKLGGEPVPPVPQVKGRKVPKPRNKSRRARQLPLDRILSFGFVGLAGLAALSLTLFWDVQGARDIGVQSVFAPSDGWCNALSWVKSNTPEPFGNPDFYYQEYNVNSRADFKYPATTYGVAAWWDYGYWITRMAHRIPTANPGQASDKVRDVARLFMSQDEPSAAEALKKMQASYVIIDYKTVTSIYWAIIVWNRQNQADFSDIYYTSEKPQDTRLQAVRLFYPEYYRSMAVRLYNFDGKPVTTPKPIVVTYKENVAPDGTPYKQVTNAVGFQTYPDAQAYLQNQKDAKARIVSNNPFISPVPLEGLNGFSLVYGSPGGVQVPDAGNVPEVKVFQYLK